MHVHACLLALHTGKPVKMSYNREESFLRPRAPAPGVDALRVRRRPRRHLVLCQGGHPVFRRRRVRLSTGAVVGNGGTMGLGRTGIPRSRWTATGVYTNNPPVAGRCAVSAAVQAAFAHEALMDELADTVGLDRIAIRQLNGMREGDRTITGQLIDSAPGGRAAGPYRVIRCHGPRRPPLAWR